MAEDYTTTRPFGVPDKRKATNETIRGPRKRIRAEEASGLTVGVIDNGAVKSPANENDKREETLPILHWKAYLQYRPSYPVSLRYQISKHHGTQNAAVFALAHDVGSSGVFAAELATMFDHVHVSDPNTEKLGEAQINLSRLFKQHSTSVTGRACTFSFSEHRGEEAHTATAANSVDMMTALDSAQWMDIDRFMDAAAHSLKSNGTFAIVASGPRVFIKNSNRADKALGETIGRIVQKVISGPANDEAEMVQFERRLRNTTIGLDFVPLDKEKWCLARSRRVRMNGRGRGPFPHSIFASEPGEMYTDPSRVRPEEVYLYFNVGEGDPEAVGFQKSVRKEWFGRYIATLIPHRYQNLIEMEEVAHLEKVIAEEFPDISQGIVVEWVVDLVLATKK
jgi:hypothetical protein